MVITIENGARLARHADHRQAVGTVGRDLAVEHGVRAAVVLAKGHADGRVLGQNHDARVVAADAQLTSGAVHAHRDDAAQLGLLDLDVAGKHRTDHSGDDMIARLEVLSAADNLQRLGVALGVDVLIAHRDLAHVHVVAIGMRSLLEYLSRDYMVVALAHHIDSLDLGAGADIFVRKLFGALGHIDHCLEPVIRNAHLALLSYGIPRQRAGETQLRKHSLQKARVVQVPQVSVKEERSVLKVREWRFERQDEVAGQA